MKKILSFLLVIFSLTAFSQSDCSTAINVCGNSQISYTPDSFGVQEIGNNACGNYPEHFSVWYSFTVATAGTLTFVIDDQNPMGDDYDFFLFGPNKTCANLGAPIRCSTAGGTGDTGLNMTSTDLFETPGGDRWVKYLDVLPGETYYLCVNNWSQSTWGFLLTWGGTATLASPFNDPSIQVAPFQLAGQDHDGKVYICESPTQMNFQSLSAGIINGNPNFAVSYYYNTNNMLAEVNPITTSISVSNGQKYYYAIRYNDPVNPNSAISKCREYGEFTIVSEDFELTPATLTECGNYTYGTATFNLTTPVLYNGAIPILTKKYYPSINDANNGTNEITNPYAYTSAPGTVYVKYASKHCEKIGTIQLQFYPAIPVSDGELTECFLPTNPTTGLFDLGEAVVSTATGLSKEFYISLQDAINGTNQISNPNAYVSTNAVVYVKLFNQAGCWNITKITLTVTPPKYSTVLQDKIICVEDRTTLDAGPGFTSYLWSTGATTQVINNVTVGAYWVDLTTGECTTRQEVKVHAAPQPVITGVDISNNTVTITVNGGTPPYQYSNDNVLWQTSNVFTNVPRGQNTFYIKDSYDCDPVPTTITVPNLVNVLTPNGDNINDVIDYSALSYKKDLVMDIYDRYGTKIFRADKTNGYRWNGYASGKKVVTGTYWYSITWTEPDTKIPVKYNGWVMVKNRD